MSEEVASAGAERAGRGRVGLALLVAWATVSSSAVFIVWAAPVPPLAIAAGREGITALAWALIALAGARRARSSSAALPAATALSARRVGLRLVISGVLLGAHFAGWVGSLSLTTVTHAAVFVSIQPLFAGLFGLFIGDRFTWRLAAGVAVAVAGSIAMAGGGHAGDGVSPSLEGDLVAVGAAAAGALYLSVNRGLADSVRLPVLLAWVNAVATLTIAAAVLASGGEWWHPDARWEREGLAILWLGLAPGLLGHGLMNWSARHVPVHVVTVAFLLEPVGAALLALALLGQSIGWPEVLGAALLLHGAALVSRSTGRPADAGED